MHLKSDQIQALYLPVIQKCISLIIDREIQEIKKRKVIIYSLIRYIIFTNLAQFSADKRNIFKNINDSGTAMTACGYAHTFEVFLA